MHMQDQHTVYWRDNTQIKHRSWHYVHLTLLAIVFITLFECSLGNLPFWRSLGASMDSTAVHNTLGSGVERLKNGGLRITDPINAYLEVISDGSSPYLRLESSAQRSTLQQEKHYVEDIRGRVDANRVSSKPFSFAPNAASNTFIEIPDAALGSTQTIRVWLTHERGAVLNIEDARANVRVPFNWSWPRVCLLALFTIFIAAFQPWSKLWRVSLNLESRLQRLAFMLAALPLIILTAFAVILQIRYATPLRFHDPGNYTYDFDQYAHVADALLKGQTHLDLPVPQALSRLSNPYDPQLRNAILAKNTPNVYWDYAFYHGRWYSYFGVLPAIVLFLPYRVISSWFIPAGAILPTGAATIICLLGFFIAGSMLVIRLAQRIHAKVSLASTWLSIILFFITSNTLYLCFRTTFYSVPMAASLMVTMIGLYHWFTASNDEVSTGVFSRKRVALGSFFIALNLGCRPTFILAGLLALVLFKNHWLTPLRALIQLTKRGMLLSSQSYHACASIARFLLITLIPVLLTFIPFGWYNACRFGSPTNFGNEYQITITDMTTMRIPSQNVLPSIFAYLGLPLRFTADFPWIGIQSIVLPQWQYVEPMIGGLFTLCPLATVALFACVNIRQLNTHSMTHIARMSMLLATLILVFDTLKAGLGWRYIADFAWLIALGAVIGLVMLLEYTLPWILQCSWRYHVLMISVRILILVLIIIALLIGILSCFVTGREDSLLRFNPIIWYTVRSWFSFT